MDSDLALELPMKSNSEISTEYKIEKRQLYAIVRRDSRKTGRILRENRRHMASIIPKKDEYTP